MDDKSGIVPSERTFGHSFVTWEIKNYGRALWQRNLEVKTPEFSIKGPNSHITKWKLMLQTEANHKSLLHQLKVDVEYKKKETSFDTFDLILPDIEKLDFKSHLNENEKEIFDSLCLNENNSTDSKLCMKNLMLYLERRGSAEEPDSVWVDWKVYYIDINGEKIFLTHDEHLFRTTYKYGFNIGTLYDFERDFEYNSGVMTIFCDMIVRDDDADVKFDNVNIDLHGLSEDLQWVFNQQMFCDAEIKVNGKGIMVHKAMLCSHSDFFESSFNEQDVVIEVSDIKYDEMLKILEYIYSYHLNHVIGQPSISICDEATRMHLTDLVAHYTSEEQNITTNIDVEELAFTWTITKFSSEKSTSILSPILTKGNCNEAWQIHLYPRGKDYKGENIAIIVKCIEGNIPDDICVQCAILNDNDDMLNTWEVLQKSEVYSGTFEIFEFIKRDVLLKMINDDSLKVGIKVKSCTGKDSSISSNPCAPVLYTLKKSFDNMVKNMQALRQSDKYADVVLKIENEEIKAHKFILYARSLYFARKLKEANNDSMIVENVSPAIFKILLDYMYFATLNVNDIVAVIDIYKAAEEFAIPRLQEKCSEILKDNITVDTVGSIFRLASEYDDKYLKTTTLHFINTNDSIFKLRDLVDLNPKSRILRDGTGISDKSEEQIHAEPIVKKITVMKYYEDSIANYNLELIIKPEGNGKSVSVNLVDTVTVSSNLFVAKCLQVPSMNKEKSSEETEIPETSDKSSKSQSLSAPLKTRYRSVSDSSDNGRRKEEIKQFLKESEVSKRNKDEVITGSVSENTEERSSENLEKNDLSKTVANLEVCEGKLEGSGEKSKAGTSFNGTEMNGQESSKTPVEQNGKNSQSNSSG